MGKKNKKYMLVILLFLVVGISVGYAALTTTLNINGATTIEKASWDIHFENLVKSDGSVSATMEASIDSTKTLIEYTVMLAEPGDYYEFTVDMVNKGTIDAMISEVLKEGLSTEQEKYIEYTATYSDGVELEEKDYLKSGETQNIKVRVKYREDISAEDLPTDESAISLSFKVTYIQADETAKEKSQLVCRRATKLHTEECTQTGTTGCSGSGYTTTGSKGTTTISYGNFGKDGILTSGDAFDCDVDGDGTYNSGTERFYYLSDLDGNNDYAVLVYYNSVDNVVAYNKYYRSYMPEYLGPETALLSMPTIEQWKNITLSNTVRDIKDELGNAVVSNFDYDGYAARLLTTQEIEKACNISVGTETTGELDNCNYLMENTYYSGSSTGYWLESYKSNDMGYAWVIDGGARKVESYLIMMADDYGVRPAIEVRKSNILY